MTFIRYLDYFFVLRPMLFFPGWSTMLAGALIIHKNSLFNTRIFASSDQILELFILMIAFAAAMGASFLLNQIKDIESDLKNQKLFIISKGHISKKGALIEVGLLSAFSLFLAYYLHLRIMLLMVIFLILTGYMYNFRPFRAKDHPWSSLFANASMGAVAYALGWFWINSVSKTFVTDLLPYLLLNTALYFFTTLPDLKGDRQSNKTTLAVKYGIEKIITVSFILFMLAVAIALYNKDIQIIFVLALSFPFFLAAIITRSTAKAVMATKFTILFFAVMVCLKLPAYFILMVMIFFCSRWYFKKRFNFDYPNFKGI